MILFFLLAMIAHAANGLVFIIDKSLLGTKSLVGNPMQYALYSSALAGATIVLLPFAITVVPWALVGWFCVAAVLHLVSLWWFFIVLKSADPSRIVPIVGSAVPLFTLLVAVPFGEVFTAMQLFGVALLIAGGALLSIPLRSMKAIPLKMVSLALIAGLGFALYFVAMKHAYTFNAPFITVFTYSRLMEAALALGILGVLRAYGKAPVVKRTRKHKGSGRTISAAFIGNKVLAAGAFLVQHYAISLGSVTIVNALQGVQYIFVFLLAAGVSIWFPKLFREELHSVAIVQKLTGIACIIIGIGFVS